MLAVLGAARAGLRTATNAATAAHPTRCSIYSSRRVLSPQAEAEKVKAEAEAMRTNRMQMPPIYESKWKIGEGIKRVELFRTSVCAMKTGGRKTPKGDKIQLRALPLRAAVRFAGGRR